MKKEKKSNSSLYFNQIISHYSLFGWIRNIPGLVLFFFILSAILFSDSKATQILGFLICIVFFVIVLMQKNFTLHFFLKVPSEIKYFSIWVAWAIITGPFVVINISMYYEDARKIIQLCLLIWVMYGIFFYRKDAFIAIPMGIITGSIIIVTRMFMNLESTTLFDQTKQEDAGTGNPNVLGAYMDLAIFSIIFLWGLAGRFRMFIAIIGIIFIPLFVYAIIVSGSRKSILLLLILICLSFIYGRTTKNAKGLIIIKIFVIILLPIIFYSYLSSFMENSLVGHRFQNFMSRGGGSISGAATENIRYSMYVEGLNMFLSNPFFGVGLGNFKAHFWSGHYSHSDYIEPLSTTGLVGFLLYQSGYFIIILKGIKLIKVVKDKAGLFCVKMIIILMFTILFLGIGAPFYNDIVIRVLLTMVSAFLFDLVKKNKIVKPDYNFHLSLHHF